MQLPTQPNPTRFIKQFWSRILIFITERRQWIVLSTKCVSYIWIYSQHGFVRHKTVPLPKIQFYSFICIKFLMSISISFTINNERRYLYKIWVKMKKKEKVLFIYFFTKLMKLRINLLENIINYIYFLFISYEYIEFLNLFA